MEYIKMPLEEQLRKAGDGLRIHAEYPACAIRAWAATPISSYLGGDSETGLGRRARFRALFGLSPGEEDAMDYRDVAKLLSDRLREGKQGQAVEALHLLAEPLSDVYQKWKEAWENAEKTT